jgi:hypothetical protein
MKNAIGIATVLSLFFLSTFITPCAANPELHVGVFGSSIIMPRQSGFVISNNGDEPILDIHWTFSIQSLSHDYADFMYSEKLDALSDNQAYVFSTQNMHGFGLVTLSITATSSNSGEVTKIIHGVKIGNVILSNTYFLSWF